MQPAIMSQSVRLQMVDFIRSHTHSKKKVSLEFGGGETFLHFDDFLCLADRFRSAFEGSADLSMHCTTNGVLLDEGRMEELAGRNVSLCFSIDGDRRIHDFHRKDKGRKGTHDAALRNWRLYRNLSVEHPLHPSCATQSVLSNHSRLPDLIDFWSSLNQQIFKAVIQMPSTFIKKPSAEKQWLARQRVYLSDLEMWATKQANTLDLERFFLDYHGPIDLFILWERIFWNRRTKPCGAGEGILAVDTCGNLYPCEAFIGQPKWQVGDIYGGILEPKLATFLDEKYSAIDHCSGCSVNAYCERCCFGRDPDQNIVDNFLEGCWFARGLVDLAERSYEVMMGHRNRAGITGA